MKIYQLTRNNWVSEYAYLSKKMAENICKDMNYDAKQNNEEELYEIREIELIKMPF